MRSKKPSAPDHTVAIIGSGFSGIAAAVYLKRVGIDDFTIFEASDSLGGTWNDNRYPGAEVDTASHLYSYSFMSYDWTTPYASQAELLQYLHDTAEQHSLLPHFRFGTEIVSAEWDERRAGYELTTGSGETSFFSAVISCVGLHNVPNVPKLPGMEDFRGQIVHTSRWRAEHTAAGKRVAIIGTGSTAAQVVPATAARAEHVTVFQRSPSWVDPKPSIPYTPAERAKLRRPLMRRLERLRIYANQESLWFGARSLKPGRADERALEKCRSYLDSLFSDRPDLKAKLTPDQPYQGKRPIHSSVYYPALLRENVTLVDTSVERFTPAGVVDAYGNEHEVDLAVMATGFQQSNFLARLRVVGRDGRSIRDAWGDDPQAFLGVMVPGFPNFFMLYGPNTNFYALVYGFERQAEFAAGALARLFRRGGGAVEVKDSYHRAYNRWLQRRLRGTSFAIGDNYFKSASGRVVTQWPDGAVLYGLLHRLLRRPATTIDQGKGSPRATAAVEQPNTERPR